MKRVLRTSTIIVLALVGACTAPVALAKDAPDAPDQAPPTATTNDDAWTKTFIAPSFRKSAKAIGSDRALPGDWPFLGVLRGAKPGQLTYYCGATAISPDWALTAAHCVEQTTETSAGADHPTYGPIEIVLGVQDLATAKPADVYRVTRVIRHGDYKPDAGANGAVSDIALLRLARPWTGDVAYLSAGGESDSDGVFARGFIAGFGRVVPTSDTLTSFQSSSGPARAYSQHLMHAMLPMKAPPACIKEYQVNGYDLNKSICAGFDAGGIDSCQGDSGGPLGALDEKGRLYQVGIVSHGYKCGVPRMPAVYTRVSAFRSFISQHAPDAKFAAVRPEPAIVATQETMTAIIALLKPSADRMQIAANPGKLDLVDGDRLQFTITSTVPGRIWVLDVDPKGAVTPVYPDPDNPPPVEKTFIEANQPLELPRFRASAPFGASRLVAMVLPRNVELIGDGMPRLDRSKGGPELISQDYAMRMLNQITLATGVDPASNGNVASWSSGEVIYSVKPKDTP